MKYLVGTVAAVLLLIAGGWIAHRAGVPLPLAEHFHFGAAEPGAAAEEQPPGDLPAAAASVVALGWLEPASGVVEISGTPGDRIEEILVSEGGQVEAGEALVYLASREIHRLEMDALKSQIAEAEARSAAEKSLADARIITAKLGVEKIDMQGMDRENLKRRIDLLKANLQLARKDLERMENLSEELVSSQERERQQLVVTQAEAELAVAEADLKKLDRTLDFSRRAAEAELNAAEAGKRQAAASIPVESLRSQLEITEAKLRQSEIRAPSKGAVLRVFMESGESIGRTPILQMADLEQMSAVAEVYETDVKRIELGQPAVVRSEAFRAPYDEDGLHGKVEAIGRLITTPELKSLDPFARADRHVVPVRVLLDQNDSRQAADFSNLQVDVVFPIVED